MAGTAIMIFALIFVVLLFSAMVYAVFIASGS
jgi:hypothetical protein